ncbi:MAG: hypothetical protein KBS79_02900, partial [Lachnospiraceae bacterium]|nr:hypothetical protein [Candidatus Minthocola equi]
MKEKIGRLARGYADMPSPEITLEPTSIEDTIEYGRINQGALRIKSGNGLSVRGALYSTSPRVTPAQNYFSGGAINITFDVDPQGLDEDDCIEGSFAIVTNGGEYSIPYSLTVVRTEYSQQSEEQDSVIEYEPKDSPEEKTFIKKKTPMGAEHKRREYYLKYMRGRLDYLAGITPSISLAMMEKNLRAYIGEKEPNFREKLEMLELAIWRGDIPRADAYIENISQMTDDMRADFEGYAFFKYLTYKKSPDWEKKEQLLRLLSSYDTRSGYLSIFLIRLMVEDSLSDRPMDCLGRLKNYYESGERTPYLYIQVCKIMNRIPETLRQFGEFELDALYFGARHGYIEESLAQAICRYADSTRIFQEKLYYILRLLYRSFKQEMICDTICRLLMLGGRTGESYLPWYEMAVSSTPENEDVYEYYLKSCPIGGVEMPEAVYLYFAYHEPQSYIARCRLYESAINNIDEYSVLYNSYKDSAESFAREEISRGVIDENIAPIYSGVLKPEKIDASLAEMLPEILLMYKIKVSDTSFTKIQIVYNELTEVQEVELTDGEARFAIYTPNYNIYFLDADGYKYRNVPYKLTQYISNSDLLLDTCVKLAPQLPVCKLAMARELMGKYVLTAEEVSELTELAGQDGLTDEYKKSLVSAVLFRHTWGSEKQDAMLIADCAGFSLTSKDENIRLIEALINLGHYDRAWKEIQTSGYEFISQQSLSQLAENIIKARLFDKDDFLTGLTWNLFVRGERGKTILHYLALHYNGLSEDMWDLMCAASAAGCELGDLPERLLAQKLFSNCKDRIDDIFRVYAAGGSVDRQILRAYYVVKCHASFVDGEPISEDIMDTMTNVALHNFEGAGLPVIVQLALTKRYSTQVVLSAELQRLCEKIIQDLISRGIVFPYYKHFSSPICLPNEINDKTLLSFKGQENDSVTLILYSENDDEEPI